MVAKEKREEMKSEEGTKHSGGRPKKPVIRKYGDGSTTIAGLMQ